LLVGGNRSPRRRVAYLLICTFLISLPAIAWCVAAGAGWAEWPSGSSTLGYPCGIIAGIIVCFEMLLWVRKKWRRKRLGPTKFWMTAHIWLGLLSLPLALIHGGFVFLGLVKIGSLSALVMIFFLIVIFSGIWGLIMQQLIPKKLLDEFPYETIVTAIEPIMRERLTEADILIARVRHGETRNAAEGAVTVAGPAYRAEQLITLYDHWIEPYLLKGKSAGGPIASRTRATQIFSDLRKNADPAFSQVVSQLEVFCKARRQLDSQARLHTWLHGWLLVHFPLSVALFVLLVAHVLFSLKYW